MPRPQQQPNWQPISQLPLIAHMIDGMTDSAEEQLVNLQQAEAQPHLLDNATVDRLIRVYTEQKNDLWLYEEQFARWGSSRRAPRKPLRSHGWISAWAGSARSLTSCLHAGGSCGHTPSTRSWRSRMPSWG
jgi:hypothetical protein